MHYDYLLKGILIFREHFLYSKGVDMKLRFSVVSAYIKPFPAAAPHDRYKHCFNSNEVPLILFLVSENMHNVK